MRLQGFADEETRPRPANRQADQIQPDEREESKSIPDTDSGACLRRARFDSKIPDRNHSNEFSLTIQYNDTKNFFALHEFCRDFETFVVKAKWILLLMTSETFSFLDPSLRRSHEERCHVP